MHSTSNFIESFWDIINILIEDVDLEQRTKQISKEIDFNLLYKRDILSLAKSSVSSDANVKWSEKLFVKIVIFANKFLNEKIFYDSHFHKLVEWNDKFENGNQVFESIICMYSIYTDLSLWVQFKSNCFVY